MKDVESYVRALGLNFLFRSYDSNQKMLGMKYIQENFTDIPDMLDYLDDKILIEIIKVHREDFKQWIVERAKKESATKPFVVGGTNE